MTARERRYALHGGWVASQNDGDRHYVPASRLATLYGLRPSEYVIWTEHGYAVYAHDFIHLWPRSDGNYSLNGRAA